MNAISNIEEPLVQRPHVARHPAPDQEQDPERQHPVEEELAQPVLAHAHGIAHAIGGQLVGQLMVPEQRHGDETLRLTGLRIDLGECADDGLVGDHRLGHLMLLHMLQEFAVGDLQPPCLLRLSPKVERQQDEQQVQDQVELRVLPEGRLAGLVDLDAGLVASRMKFAVGHGVVLVLGCPASGNGGDTASIKGNAKPALPLPDPPRKRRGRKGSFGCRMARPRMDGRKALQAA